MNLTSVKPKGKAPAVMFYTGDFLSSPDVQAMEGNEVGCYCMLLFNAWQTDKPGYLPNDEGKLRRLGKMSVEQWAESRVIILSKFPVAPDPAFRFNPRMAAEAEKQASHRQQQSLAGKSSAEKRASLQRESNENPTTVDLKATTVENMGNETATFHIHTSLTSTIEQNTLGGVGETSRSADASLSPISLEVKACSSISELGSLWKLHPGRWLETGFKNLFSARRGELEMVVPEKVNLPPASKIKPAKVDPVADPALSFEAFWRAYGWTKGNKQKATDTWVKLPADVRSFILQGLPAYILGLRDRQYQPHATTFLNAKLWCNESYSTPDAPIKPLTVSHRNVGGVAPTETILPSYQQKNREQATRTYR